MNCILNKLNLLGHQGYGCKGGSVVRFLNWSGWFLSDTFDRGTGAKLELVPWAHVETDFLIYHEASDSLPNGYMGQRIFLIIYFFNVHFS